LVGSAINTVIKIVIMIPKNIKIKNNKLPDSSGVYFFFDSLGRLLYVGKAASLKRRVGSYFVKANESRIAEMVGEVANIDYIKTQSVIEALILEANEIKARKPKYNILQRDDKSFLHLAITNESFPRPMLIREHDLRQKDAKKFLRVFGPYISAGSLKTALEIIRKAIPWSDCVLSKNGKACFDFQIGKCPGVCVGAINKRDYRKIIRQLILFFEGKKPYVARSLRSEMKRASDELRYEEAVVLRKRLFALEHINDIALISREDSDLPLSKRPKGMNLMGRIEGFDISNISGASAVGSMVVFENGKPSKHLYRRFKIKTVKGVNDVAMLEEVLRRRLARNSVGWELPVLMVVDGGEPQVNRARALLKEFGAQIPIVGIAKGLDRKQDRFCFGARDVYLQNVVTRGKELFLRVRDEAHRFAIQYHRLVRGKQYKRKKTRVRVS
jgi:excinuclease ABC subunit C